MRKLYAVPFPPFTVSRFFLNSFIHNTHNHGGGGERAKTKTECGFVDKGLSYRTVLDLIGKAHPLTVLGGLVLSLKVSRLMPAIIYIKQLFYFKSFLIVLKYVCI